MIMPSDPAGLWLPRAPRPFAITVWRVRARAKARCGHPFPAVLPSASRQDPPVTRGEAPGAPKPGTARHGLACQRKGVIGGPPGDREGLPARVREARQAEPVPARV